MSKLFFFFCILLLPGIVLAATPRNFAEVVSFILGYVKLLVALLFGVTFVIFIWGVVKAWVIGGSNSESIEEGQQLALWGIIGLAVMAGMWGIIMLVRKSLGL